MRLFISFAQRLRNAVTVVAEFTIKSDPSAEFDPVQEDSLKFQAQRAVGQWYDTVQDTLLLVHDPDALQSFEITISPAAPVMPADNQPEWYKAQVLRLQDFWLLLVELGSARSWSQIQFAACLPNAFAAVLHPEQGLADRSLKGQRRTWAAVLQAEKLLASESLPRASHAALSKLLNDMAWHRLQLAREIYLVGTEGSWSSQNAQIKEQAFLMCSGSCCTKFDLEDLFAHLVQVSRSSNSNSPMNKCFACTLIHGTS